MRTYVTKQGDMWDAIAYRELGSEYYTGTLLKANLKYANHYILPEGITLKIPDSDQDTDGADLMPPWKTGGTNG